MSLPEWTQRNIAIAAGGAVGLVLLLLIIAQLVLPGLAASKIAGDLEDIGPRPDVEVKAFPAVKLLFKKADKVEVTMESARTDGSAALADQLERADDVDEMDVKIGTVTAGPLVARDVEMKKDGDEITATADVRQADIERALPAIFTFKPVPQQDGNGLLLAGSVEVPLLGSVDANARVKAEGGGITAAPEGIPLADELLKLTIFSDPRVIVSSLTAQRQAAGFRMTVSGSVNP